MQSKMKRGLEVTSGNVVVNYPDMMKQAHLNLGPEKNNKSITARTK